MIFTKAANLAFLCQHRQRAGKQRNKNLSKTILSQTDYEPMVPFPISIRVGNAVSMHVLQRENEFRKSPHLATLSYEIFIRYPK